MPLTNNELPEPVFAFASWGRRVGAGLIDYGPASMIFFFGVYADPVVFLLLFLAVVGFQLWNMYQQGLTGQTVGKRLLGLLLVRESDAQPVGPARSIARWVAHLADTLPCGVGYLNPLWDGKHQTFADKVLRTVVIDVP